MTWRWVRQAGRFRVELAATKGIRAAALASALALGSTGVVQAATVTFVPPNDSVGYIHPYFYNDGWSDGRGVVFEAAANIQLTGVGVYVNLGNSPLSYTLQQVSALNGQIDTGATTLASGSTVVNTSTSFAFVDFSFPTVSLLAGHDYYVDFYIPGTPQGSFYYSNNNVRFDAGSFSQIDGTLSGNTGNTVMPAVRLTTAETAVPEPGSLAVLGVGVAILAMASRRRAA